MNQLTQTIHQLFWTAVWRIGTWLVELANRRLQDYEEMSVTIKREWL